MSTMSREELDQLTEYRILLSLPEIAAALRVSYDVALALVNNEHVPAIKIGTNWFSHRDLLSEHLRGLCESRTHIRPNVRADKATQLAA